MLPAWTTTRGECGIPKRERSRPRTDRQTRLPPDGPRHGRPMAFLGAAFRIRTLFFTLGDSPGTKCEELMVNNLPVKTLVHKDLTIEGYSRAAVQTYWRLPELKIGFDLGGQPWSFMGTRTWFLSHTHLDHVAALPVYVARRRMMKMEPPTIYLPEGAIEHVERMLKLFTRLDRGRLPCRTAAGATPGTRSSCRASTW